MQMSWRPETKLKSVIQAPNIEIFEYLSRHPPSPPRPPPNSPSIELFVSSKRKKSFKADDGWINKKGLQRTGIPNNLINNFDIKQKF